jgi:hypothetical protein
MSLKASKILAIISVAAIMLPHSASANPKKRRPPVDKASQLPPAKLVRVPGYAILELDSGKRDRIRVTEGEARASLPNILANDVDLITVIGANTVVTVFEQPNFRGHSLTLTCGNYELIERPRNDIESVRVSYRKQPVSECQGSDRELVQIKSWDR